MRQPLHKRARRAYGRRKYQPMEVSRAVGNAITCSAVSASSKWMTAIQAANQLELPHARIDTPVPAEANPQSIRSEDVQLRCWPPSMPNRMHKSQSGYKHRRIECRYHQTQQDIAAKQARSDRGRASRSQVNGIRAVPQPLPSPGHCTCTPRYQRHCLCHTPGGTGEYCPGYTCKPVCFCPVGCGNQ